MRILLVDECAWSIDGGEPRTIALARTLLAAGHEVRVLWVESSPNEHRDIPGRRVTCRREDEQADLRFDAPAFVVPLVRTDPPPTSRRQTANLLFTQLTDSQLADYREALRKALDDEAAAFDPQIIHCQHAWVGGHLALETGVPYLLNVHGEEMATQAADARYRRLVQESIENAGRVLVTTPQLQHDVLAICGENENRVLLVDEPMEPRRLIAIYQQVIDERMQ
jgi:hypothetical protein